MADRMPTAEMSETEQDLYNQVAIDNDYEKVSSMYSQPGDTVLIK